MPIIKLNLVIIKYKHTNKNYGKCQADMVMSTLLRRANMSKKHKSSYGVVRVEALVYSMVLPRNK